MVDHNELLPPGKELGGFRIETQLGNGNMGIIYRAIQINLNRPVALKVLFRRVAADQDFVRSFFREAQAAAAFTHQNIVQAFDVGQSSDGIYYFAMELIEGGDIDDRLKEDGPYTAEEAVELMVSIADGLDYGSSLRKLTHGDIKPANIMLTKNMKPKLADLGLARMGGEIQGESDGIMLTPLYAAPEMIQGQWNVGDPRADMYSVGATLYHMITGAPPFQDDDYRNVIHMQVNNQHTPLHDVDSNVPLSISKLVDKLLEKHPDDRFSSWDEAKKAMTHSLKTAHVKESKKKKKVLHYHKTEEHHHKKVKSKTPLLVTLLIVLAIGGLLAFNLTQKSPLKEFKSLEASISNDSVDNKILKIEEFIRKHGTATPNSAKEALNKLLNSQAPSKLYNFDLSQQNKIIDAIKQKLDARDSNTIKNLVNNADQAIKLLNKNLPNNNGLHFPFNDSNQNFSNYTQIKNISVKGDIQYPSGKIGKAIKLNGGSINYGDLPQTRFSRSGSFTFSFWVKPDKLTSPVLGKCEITNGQLSKGYLVSLNNGRMQFSLFGDGPGNMMETLSINEVKINEWSHIILQYSNEKSDIYINGKKQEVQSSSSLSKNFACSGSFVIGSKYFEGSIDDVKIWPRKLSQNEISETFHLTTQTPLEKSIQKLRKLIETAKTLNSEEKSPNNTDLTRKQNFASDSKIAQLLTELATSPHQWEIISKRIVESINKSNEFDAPFYKFLAQNLKESRTVLLELFKQKQKELSKFTLANSTLKLHKIERSYVTLREHKDYGAIQNYYYYDEFKSKDVLTSLTNHAIKYSPEIFKDSGQACLAALLITNGDILRKLYSIVTEQRSRKFLKRISMELGKQ